MALIKLNNRGVKDATAFGSISSLGSLTFISKQTASSSATISFTSGIDSTYKEYIFYFINMHPSASSGFTFQTSTNGGSSYGVTTTTTYFQADHPENDSSATLTYVAGSDLAQSTNFQTLSHPSGVDDDNDASFNGVLSLFNPSSTTFVKHFISRGNAMYPSWNVNSFVSGYFNTTSAINAVQFKFSSGNIDSGDILLFGLN
mgnify:CR=1 FL=1